MTVRHEMLNPQLRTTLLLLLLRLLCSEFPLFGLSWIEHEREITVRQQTFFDHLFHPLV